jgi:hypothetical protein
MQCANPDCQAPAADLNTGVLSLIELDVAPDERVIRSDGGFPVCSVPSRYFWVCQSCSVFLRIKRWTPGGLVFATRDPVPTMNGRALPIDRIRPRILVQVTRKSA